MIKKILTIVLSFVLLYSCNNKEDHKPATALDTGRSFIRASLDGNFETAEQFIQVVKTFKADEGLKQNVEKLEAYLSELEK